MDRLDLLQKALQQKRRAADSFRRGNECCQHGHYQEAAGHFEQAIVLDPTNAAAYNNLGTTYDRLGRCEEAIRAYMRAIEIDPEDAELYGGLGVAYAHLDRDEEAIGALRQSIKLDPHGPGAPLTYFHLGIVCLGARAWKQAIRAFKMVIRLMPDCAVAHTYLGIAYLFHGKKHSAVREYQVLKKLDAELGTKLAGWIDDGPDKLDAQYRHELERLATDRGAFASTPSPSVSKDARH